MLLACAACVGCAVLAALPPRASARRRLPREPVRGAARRVPVRVIALAGIASLGFLALSGLSTGTAVAIVVALLGAAAARIARERRSIESRADLCAAALAIDLVAACIESGATMAAAFAAGGGAFASAGRALGVGDDERAYALLSATPALRPVAGVCRRSSRSGAGTADELRRIAARHRQEANLAARRRARRASVWVVLPLGLCFLPAFVLLAVVPVVAGLVPALR